MRQIRTNQTFSGEIASAQTCVRNDFLASPWSTLARARLRRKSCCYQAQHRPRKPSPRLFPLHPFHHDDIPPVSRCPSSAMSTERIRRPAMCLCGAITGDRPGRVSILRVRTHPSTESLRPVAGFVTTDRLWETPSAPNRAFIPWQPEPKRALPNQAPFAAPANLAGMVAVPATAAAQSGTSTGAGRTHPAPITPGTGVLDYTSPTRSADQRFRLGPVAQW